MSHEAATNSELEFFANGMGQTFYDSQENRCGTANLKNKLANLLIRQMNEQVPSILSSLRKLESEYTEKYKTYNEIVEKSNVIM